MSSRYPWRCFKNKFSRRLWCSHLLEMLLPSKLVIQRAGVTSGSLGRKLRQERGVSVVFHLRRLKMLFLLELLSAELRPMRSRAFSSSSCCCWLVSDFPSDAFPRRSTTDAGFRRSFSFIIWPVHSKDASRYEERYGQHKTGFFWLYSCKFKKEKTKNIIIII